MFSLAQCVNTINDSVFELQISRCRFSTTNKNQIPARDLDTPRALTGNSVCTFHPIITREFLLTLIKLERDKPTD